MRLFEAAVMTIPPALLKLMDLGGGAELALSVERGKLRVPSAGYGRKRFSMAEPSSTEKPI